ncbi:trigger factor [Treponema rectale]|uniref:peptidylprolyl isomerase n=1 Tax=Treponema rectale TaxID=744512 RepID=A0A7M1XI87_9SPIR|nr:trigger factor [Treponema rectale]
MANLFAAYTKNHLGKEAIPPVSEADIQVQLQSMLKQHVHTATKEGTASEGDIVNIDFEGFLEGVPFEGGKGEKYDLELGSHTFIPGFEEQLIGHKANDDVEVNVTFPKEYQAENLSGKAVVFKCHVHEVKSKVEMKLNDEFAAHLGLKSLEELKEAVKNDITHQRQNEADKTYLEKLLRHLVTTSTIDVTPEQVEEAKNKIVDFYTNSVARYGMTLEAYLSTMGMDKEKFMLTIQDEAANTARTDILTNYIIEKENLNANEEEINAQVQLIKNYYHLTDDKVEELIKDHKEDIKNDITKEKVAEFLLKNND